MCFSHTVMEGSCMLQNPLPSNTRLVSQVSFAGAEGCMFPSYEVEPEQVAPKEELLSQKEEGGVSSVYDTGG